MSTAPIAVDRVPRAVVAEHQRQRILDAAIPIFAKRGYRQTTVESHIVPAAKISIGHFYQHFADKEDCFLAAYEEIVAEGHEQILAAVPIDTWPEQLIAVLLALIDFIAQNHLKARLVLVEMPAVGPRALRRYQQTLELFAPALARGRELTPPGTSLPASLETSTIGGLLWVLQQRLLAEELEPSRRLLAEMVEMVAGPYLGEAETKKLIARH